MQSATENRPDGERVETGPVARPGTPLRRLVPARRVAALALLVVPLVLVLTVDLARRGPRVLGFRGFYGWTYLGAIAESLVVWGTLLVSTADNWIKPLFIGGRAKLPTFLLLMSILGGLKVYGFLGVFLGPVVLAILFTFVGIYREEYQEPAVAVPPPADRLDRAAVG